MAPFTSMYDTFLATIQSVRQRQSYRETIPHTLDQNTLKNIFSSESNQREKYFFFFSNVQYYSQHIFKALPNNTSNCNVKNLISISD